MSLAAFIIDQFNQSKRTVYPVNEIISLIIRYEEAYNAYNKEYSIKMQQEIYESIKKLKK